MRGKAPQLDVSPRSPGLRQETEVCQAWPGTWNVAITMNPVPLGRWEMSCDQACQARVTGSAVVRKGSRPEREKRQKGLAEVRPRNPRPQSYLLWL